LKLQLALLFLVLLVMSVAVTAVGQTAAPIQSLKISITPKGFEPSSITLKKGVPATITFIRQTSDTCATSVQIPEYKIKRELPLNQAVTVEINPTKTGEFAFMCGMNMLKGSLVVVEQ
jgi:plastocyanin domain-containing protein